MPKTFAAIIKQPNGAIRTKYFKDKEQAKAWLDEPGRYRPEGTQVSIEEVK
jgi:hypothetical protein